VAFSKERTVRISPVVAVLVGALAASGQVMEAPGGRAPSHGAGAVERRALTVPVDDGFWAKAAIRGVPVRDGELVIPPSQAGDPLRVGVNSRPPSGSITWDKAGIRNVEGGQAVWRVRVDAPGVDGVRLCLAGLDLAAGESIVVAGSEGLGYVIRWRGANGDGREWTPVLAGEHAYVEWRGSAARFAIEEVAEIVWPRGEGGVIDLLPCHVDVQCETVDPVARDSVGRMVYSTPQGTFVCTGALLNDANPGTTLGWFLTSDSCINSAAAAASVTVYWFYQTPSCGGAVPALGSLPVSQGAELLVSAPSSDAAFLKLSQDPANGQGLAGWTGAEPAGPVATIHHPEGGYKRIARGAATLSTPICFGERGHYQYHSIDYTQGITESGSVGAPLFDSTWRVVGHLSGVCAFATPTCDNGTLWNAVFGRFSRTLPRVCASLTGQSSLARVYVDASATGQGTGASWVDAYTTLGAALGGACPPTGGMEVWVADGVYKPSGAGRESAFALVDGVALYGGFVGGETSFQSRKPGMHVAVLSGDLAGNDAPGFVNRSDNALHVVRGTGVGSSAVLDGFTVRAGNADGAQSFNDKGGGLYVEDGFPRVRGCIFEDHLAGFSGAAMAFNEDAVMDVAGSTFIGNRAMFGGAIGMTTAAGVVASSVFEGNTSMNDGGAVDLYESQATVQGCTFKANSAADGGGGLSSFASGPVVLQGCHFEDNGAAVGGAVQAVGGSISLANCVMMANHAGTHGGGLIAKVGAQATVTACRFLGNSAGQKGGGVYTHASTADVSNSELSGNRGVPGGGGALWANGNSQVEVLNCTLSRNTAATLGGALMFETGTGSVTNCVLWGNSDSEGSGERGQVRYISGATGSVSRSIVQGWTGSISGVGSIGSDPLLVSPLGGDGSAGTLDDDLGTGAGSPARDAGSNAAAQALLTDVRGNARRQDDPCVVDTGTGTAPIVDMGAVEGAPCGCYANCDGSTASPVLTGNDFVCFLTRFVAGEPYANCDESTVPPVLNANDFVCFLTKFVVGCS
jgi:hypothetical protein